MSQVASTRESSQVDSLTLQDFINLNTLSANRASMSTSSASSCALLADVEASIQSRSFEQTHCLPLFTEGFS